MKVKDTTQEMEKSTMKKSNILKIVGFSLVLILQGTMVSADQTETDGTNDVFHWWQSGGTFTWEYDSSKPNIDITEVSYVTSGDSITLSITVDGEIVDDELISYSVILSNADSESGSTIGFAYTNGEGTSYYYSMNGGGTGNDPVVSGNTISTTFDTTLSDDSGYEIIATAYQYTVLNDQTAEYWVDSNEPMANEDDDSGDTSVDDNGDDSGTDDSGSTDSGDTGNDDENTNVPPPSGTPGFEFFALIAAFAAIAFIIKKRK
jgi:hypothetical protein